jgi:hypothetical protein
MAQAARPARAHPRPAVHPVGVAPSLLAETKVRVDRRVQGDWRRQAVRPQAEHLLLAELRELVAQGQPGE